jgi:SsrA-binding protein
MTRSVKRQSPGDRIRVVAVYRKARRDYEILETMEAGLVLVGSEVKSLRAGKVSLSDSYGRFDGENLFVYNMHVSAYEKAHQFNHDPLRPRQLLLRRRDLQRLMGKVKERGFTLVPLSIYFKNGWAKCELAVARGKKAYDKRDTLARRDAQREIERAQRIRS